MIHFVCVRTGDKYPIERVEVLCDMIARHHLDPHRFYCLTDGDVPDGIEKIDATLPGWWGKVELFSDRMPWNEGDLIAYFDLDVCITGRLEKLQPGIIKDWYWPCFNSSVMVWRHGEHRQIWDQFDPAIMDAPGDIVPVEMLASGMVNGGDQEWITKVAPDFPVFPAEWFVSHLMAQAWPPSGCKAVVFHGKDKPWLIEDGWVPNVYKPNGWTAPPVMDGVNVSCEHLLDNIKANIGRDIPWFTGFDQAQTKEAVIVCGGPSLKDAIPAIKAKKKAGATIITVNNTLSYLMARGIKPNAHVMLDARPENVEFLKGAPDGVRYFLASQCHPSLFDALAGKDVSMWHSNSQTLEKDIDQILKPYWDQGPNQKPCVKVPGGGTVGLRAMCLAWLSGYKQLHVYGMDGCYSGGKHHAYSQGLNDGERTIEITVGGKLFRCAMWMVRQTEEFRWTWQQLKSEGVEVFVHGRGLIPHIWKTTKG